MATGPYARVLHVRPAGAPGHLRAGRHRPWPGLVSRRSMSVQRRRRRQLASYAAMVGGGLVGLAVVSATGLATYFTRRVVTPLAVKPDDLEIFEVLGDRLVLSSTPDTRVPGRYGLWLGGGAGHVRIGRIVDDD